LKDSSARAKNPSVRPAGEPLPKFWTPDALE
jgi:hypothetical protein